MKKKLFFAAVALVALASCSDNEFIGDNSPTTQQENAADEIQFGFEMQKVTRADIAGTKAAELLGDNFYVAGTKADMTLTSPIPATTPTTLVVFDNYLVHHEANSAGTQEDNTANWEYVGVVPGTAPTANHVKLSPDKVTAQTIKFWDYSTTQYDFLAFSTGTFKAVANTSGGDDQIGVTAMKYGSALSGATAYTFDLPSISALENTFITDITPVAKSDYGKEVTLKFKNLGSKVRVALYETVPGYSIKAESVKFYTEDGTTDFTDAKDSPAALISAYTNSFASKGTVAVSFPNMGTDNISNNNYNKAAVTVTAGDGATSKTFGDLATEKYQTEEGSETTGSLYLGRTLPEATFAGDKYYNYYKTVFPVSVPHPLTLRVDYTLVSTDGSGEEITVLGAKAVVPSTYTVWQPNYAYTYIFKISDNTNGWTDPEVATSNTPAGLYPITFDAVVAEFTDVNAEQTTITTVAAPSITTYQQKHAYTTNEYSKATGKDVYVQVKKDGVLVADLNTKESTKYSKSFLYLIDDDDATEAMVMDALEKRTTTIVGAALDANVTGRNGIALEYKAIDNDVVKILNGVDDNPINIAAGKAAKLDMAALSAGTYAYVYDWTSGSKTEIKEFQPVAKDPTTGKFKTAGSYTVVSTSVIDADASSTTAANEDVDHAYLYFTRTQNADGTTYTYSYVSVAGKTKLPAGLIKVAKSGLSTTQTVTTSDSPAANTFYFDTYFSNNGSYAVKVIKVVD